MTLFDAPTGRAGAAADDAGGSTTYRMLVAYDGTDCRGCAAQPGIRTGGGALAEAIEKVAGRPVELTCAGRTDAGVHAWGQVVSFRAGPDLPVVRVLRGVNSMLGPEVVARSCERAPEGFDARHSARWRHYRYTIVNRPVPDPFRDRFTWWIPDPLDLHALRLAADPIVGEHDFASFCRRGPEGSTTVRRVLESRWIDEGDGVLRYEIRASAFCWQMVRSVVGTLVEAGIGRKKPGEVLAILRAGDRAAAGQLAPPRGLCLWEVGY